MSQHPGESSGFAPIAALVKELGESGRPAADEEIRRLRAYFADVALYRRPNVARADDEIDGWEWEGQSVRAGEYLDRSAAKFLRHVEFGQEWPTGTTLEQYLSSLGSAVRNPNGGIYLEWFDEARDAWRLAFVARSGRRRGPGGDAHILVTFLADEARWLTGFQPPRALAYLTRYQGERAGRWLRRM